MYNWFKNDTIVQKLISVHGYNDKGSISNKWRIKWINDIGLAG